jgi:hypothetical protein
MHDECDAELLSSQSEGCKGGRIQCLDDSPKPFLKIVRRGSLRHLVEHVSAVVSHLQDWSIPGKKRATALLSWLSPCWVACHGISFTFGIFETLFESLARLRMYLSIYMAGDTLCARVVGSPEFLDATILSVSRTPVNRLLPTWTEEPRWNFVQGLSGRRIK